MDSFLEFFENMPSWQKLAWIFICLSFNWIIEGFVPLIKFNYKKWRHAGVNMIFLSCSLAINILIGLATVGMFIWLGQNEFGLLYLVNWPIWLELITSILILDFFAQYVVHFLLHRIKWMWKFHMVHHSDTKVDATTGTRHHPGDYLLREVFGMIAIFFSGIPLAFYVFYKIVTIFFTYITHANIVVPLWLDKTLSLLFITPNMHKFHHHFKRPWTDTNFGNIFSVFDRLFGTFVYDDPKKIRYGLDVLDDQTDENVGYQFKIPFDKSIKTDY
jgi:sterol desaturase/sphingolipid hydroxylase (fatty acid hydroxylase superfamily)